MYDGEQKALAEAMEGFFVLSHFLRGAIGKVGDADLKIASYGNPMRGRSRPATSLRMATLRARRKG